MTLIFSGTSNYIMSRSSIDTIKNIVDENIINCSIGASPSQTSLYSVKKLNCKPGDVVFLDYTITDGFYISSNESNNETIKKDIVSIINYLEYNECLPILVINPCQLSLCGATPSERIHIDICKEYCIPMINVSELFRRVILRGRRKQHLLRDDAHQSHIVTPLVAQALADAARLIRIIGPTVRLNGEPIWIPRTQSAAPLVDPDKRISFSSRIASTEMARVGINDPLWFDVKANETVLGLVVNMSGPGAKIRLRSTSGEEIRDLIYDWENTNPKAFMSIYVSLRQVLEGGQSGVTLEILPIDGPPALPDIFRPQTLEHKYEEISIEGLLIGQSGTAKRVRSMHPAQNIDLLSRDYDRLVEEIFLATEEYDESYF